MLSGDSDMDRVHCLEPLASRHDQGIFENGGPDRESSSRVQQGFVDLNEVVVAETLRSDQDL
jgi:hypothetical protein